MQPGHPSQQQRQQQSGHGQSAVQQSPVQSVQQQKGPQPGHSQPIGIDEVTGAGVPSVAAKTAAWIIVVNMDRVP